MPLRPILLAALLAAPLAACDNGPGTTISINAGDEDGNGTATVGSDGRVALNVPGFSGAIKLPKLKVNADNFEMNGVHLYPGSTIATMNIDAKSGGSNDDLVKVGFTSPAKPEVVRDWFVTKLNAAGFKVKPAGLGATGTTDEGKPFQLDLAPDGSDKAKGTIRITG